MPGDEADRRAQDRADEADHQGVRRRDPSPGPWRGADGRQRGQVGPGVGERQEGRGQGAAEHQHAARAQPSTSWMISGLVAALVAALDVERRRRSRPRRRASVDPASPVAVIEVAGERAGRRSTGTSRPTVGDRGGQDRLRPGAGRLLRDPTHQLGRHRSRPARLRLGAVARARSAAPTIVRRPPSSAASVKTTTPPGCAAAACRLRRRRRRTDPGRSVRPRRPPAIDGAERSSRSCQAAVARRSPGLGRSSVAVGSSAVVLRRQPLAPRVSRCVGILDPAHRGRVGRPLAGQDVGVATRRCPCRSAPAACRSPGSRPRRWRWRCRARPRRRRSRRRRRPPARCGCGAAPRRGRRTARVSGSRPESRARPSHHDRDEQDHAEHRHDRRGGDPERAAAVAGGHGAVRRRRRCRRRAAPRRATGERSDGRRSPRRPASTATTSWRDAIQAGTTAASTALTQAEGGDRRRGSSHGTLEGPEPRRSEALHQRQQQPRPSADAEHDADAPRRPAPSTTPLPRITRRACGGVPPEAAISARVRDVAAGADGEGRPGEQDDLDQRHHDDQHDDRDASRRCRCRSPRCSAVGRDVGGGSASDGARERPRPPIALSARTSAQGPGRAVDQPARRDVASSRPAEVADGPEQRPGSRARRGLAPTPTIRQRRRRRPSSVVADGEALVEHRVVDHDLAGAAGQPAVLEVEEPGGERVAQVDAGGWRSRRPASSGRDPRAQPVARSGPAARPPSTRAYVVRGRAGPSSSSRRPATSDAVARVGRLDRPAPRPSVRDPRVGGAEPAVERPPTPLTSAVLMTTSAALTASTGRPIITSTRTLRPRWRSASRQAIRSAGRQPLSEAPRLIGRASRRRAAPRARRRRSRRRRRRRAGRPPGRPRRRAGPRG